MYLARLSRYGEARYQAISGKRPQSRRNVYKQMYPRRIVDLVDQPKRVLDNDDVGKANRHEGYMRWGEGSHVPNPGAAVPPGFDGCF